MIHVCSLARLHDTVRKPARAISSRCSRTVDWCTGRPRSRRPTICCSTWTTSPSDRGLHPPAEEHVGELVGSCARWDRRAPLVVHCYAGISRSTAGAFIAACALNPHRDESKIARAIRKASPTAMPNIRMVSHRRQACSGATAAWRGGPTALGPGGGLCEGETVPARPRMSMMMAGMAESSTPIEVGLTAAIVAVEAEEPRILDRGRPESDTRAGLPFGAFDPLAHRTFEIGLRAWVEAQTALAVGYVEQLYTFGDRGRHARAGDRPAYRLGRLSRAHPHAGQRRGVARGRRRVRAVVPLLSRGRTGATAARRSSTR